MAPPPLPPPRPVEELPVVPQDASHLRFTVPKIIFRKQPGPDWPRNHHMCSAAHCYYPNSPKPVPGKYDCLGQSWCGGRCRGTYTVSLEEAQANDAYYQQLQAMDEWRAKQKPPPKDPYERDSVVREKVFVNARARTVEGQTQVTHKESSILVRQRNEWERLQQEAEEVARLRMERGGCCLPGLTEMAQAIIRPLSPSTLRSRSRSRKRSDQKAAITAPPPPLPNTALPARTSSLLPSPPSGQLPAVPSVKSGSTSVHLASHHSSIGRSTRTARATLARHPLPEGSLRGPLEPLPRATSPNSFSTMPVAGTPRERPRSPSSHTVHATLPLAHSPRTPPRVTNSRPTSPAFRSTSPVTPPPRRSSQSTSPTSYSTDGTAYSAYAATHSTRATTPSPTPPRMGPSFAGAFKDLQHPLPQGRRSSASSSSHAGTMSESFYVSVPPSSLRKSRKSLPRKSHKSVAERSMAESHWSRAERGASPTNVPPPPMPVPNPTPAQSYAATYRARHA
ncbi:hypothetical protein K525DRAFT_265586 [Schizophyllum commune Loenen D]|nr:hypothetical protein K525DRAFT_265586 [Schizophyllum commune Loenen D]